MRTRTGAFALLVALGVLGFAAMRGRLRRYEIVEASMEPALSEGDYIIAQARTSKLERGDIVIVPHPNIVGFDLIKRVVGLPGELVALADGQVRVDGHILAEIWADGPVHPDDEVQLGQAQVYVLGDNRTLSSADSRTIGPVATADIRWKATARYWPAARVGRLT